MTRHRGMKILLGGLILLAVWAGYQVFQDIQHYRSAENQYQSLEDEITKIEDSKGTGENQDNDRTKPTGDKGQKRKPPITADFQKLRQKPGGDKAVAWIYIEALDISYPVMQAEDNDYYLHRNMAGDYEYSGCVFLDSENSPDFTDPNSIVFGHNMADGSMFGRLKEFSIEDAYNRSPYLWILTEQGNRCYQIFSVQVVSVTEECYTLFSKTGQAYVEFLDRMRLNSGIDTGAWQFRQSDQIVTLSTCNGDGQASTRYVVQGVKIDGDT